MKENEARKRKRVCDIVVLEVKSVVEVRKSTCKRRMEEGEEEEERTKKKKKKKKK